MSLDGAAARGGTEDTLRQALSEAGAYLIEKRYGAAYRTIHAAYHDEGPLTHPLPPEVDKLHSPAGGVEDRRQATAEDREMGWARFAQENIGSDVGAALPYRAFCAGFAAALGVPDGERLTASTPPEARHSTAGVPDEDGQG